MNPKQNAFSLLSKPLREAIKEKGFLKPTEPQQRAIPPILEGRNVLLIAPTATGKTEAAILPILNSAITSREKQLGIGILYITPLRALNRDLLERLEWWCSRVDVKVAVRHGDTEVAERGKQAKSPPGMLITTPETLQAILTGRVMRSHLRNVRHLIVDEVHELAEDKRGSQLSLALERLRWVTERDFQMVGLSATIGTPEAVARFLVGSGREVEVVKVPVARKMNLKILYPKPTPADYQLASKLYTHPEVAARLRIMRSLIKNHSSTLLFTNTRAVAEVLASRFKVWDEDFPVSIHHGSLAKPARITAERGLKNGELRSLICTSSLELGIDVGRVDFVIQYMSPKQVTRLIQRVGRSGHRVGRMADGVVVAMDSDDALEAMVIARRAYIEDLEQVSIPQKPLDALTHQIAGLLIQRRRWFIPEVLELFTKAYPYEKLDEKDLLGVLNYMHSRYPRLAWFSAEDKVFLRPQRGKEMYRYYFEKLSMIPDEKQYLVIDESSDTPVGVLDEAFVAEYGEPGVKFIVRGSAWRLNSIRGDKIYVKPISDPTGAIPSWVGEEIPVPFDVAREVGLVRSQAADKYREGAGRKAIAEELAGSYPIDVDTLLEALKETFEQVDKGFPVPGDRRIVVEDWEDYVIANTHFGTSVNRTLARIIGHLLSEEIGYAVGVQQDSYRIVVQTGGRCDSEHIIKILKLLAEADVEQLASKASLKTGLFKRRMVHVARRFGAISRWVDFSNISLRQLMKSFEGTVVLDEALKETLEKDLDVPNTVKVVGEIRNGAIEIIRIKTGGEATPIARIGIERISQRTDLIPPEKMKRILLDSAKVRILNEVKTLVCTSCWKSIRMLRIKDLPRQLKCPECGSKALGALDQSDEDVARILEKGGRALSTREQSILRYARETALLVEKYGKTAVMVLAGKRIDLSDAEEILMEHKKPSDELFESIIEAEKNMLRRRFL